MAVVVAVASIALIQRQQIVMEAVVVAVEVLKDTLQIETYLVKLVLMF